MGLNCFLNMHFRLFKTIGSIPNFLVRELRETSAVLFQSFPEMESIKHLVCQFAFNLRPA